MGHDKVTTHDLDDNSDCSDNNVGGGAAEADQFLSIKARCYQLCVNYFSFVPETFSSMLQSCPHLTLANRTYRYINYREVNSMALANASCCQATCIVAHVRYLFTT